MTAADPVSLAALHAQAFAAPWSADTFADLLSQPGVLAVSEPDGFTLIRTRWRFCDAPPRRRP